MYCPAALTANRFFLLSNSTRARNCLKFDNSANQFLRADVPDTHWLSIRPSSSSYSSALIKRAGSDLRLLLFFTCLAATGFSSTKSLSLESSSRSEFESSAFTVFRSLLLPIGTAPGTRQKWSLQREGTNLLSDLRLPGMILDGIFCGLVVLILVNWTRK